MKPPNLRTWQPTENDAKNVMDTPMLDTTAHETPETVKATNENIETVVTHPAFGKLGATGRE